MDKNTIITFSLIAAIFIAYMQFTKQTPQQIENQKKYNDSIALVQQNATKKTIKNDTTPKSSASSNDSTKSINPLDSYGEFDISAKGEEKFITLENQFIKLKISTKGGRIYSALLKNYSDRNKKPLILFEGDESQFGFTIVTKNNRVMNTADLYFEPLSEPTIDKNGNQFITLRLKTKEKGYIDFMYTLPKNEYMISMNIKANEMASIMPVGTNSLEMKWSSKIRQQEMGRKFENRYAQLSYKFLGDDVETLKMDKDDSKELTTKVQWIAFKDQFFSSILIAENSFTSTKIKSQVENDSSKYLKSYTANTSISFDPTGKASTNLRMYLGPNQYKILSAYDKNQSDKSELLLNKLIPLGWGFLGAINRYAIIPMFNFFSGFLSNFGIIILLLTIVIKLVLFPLTYKSFISAAKMRVLKPEIDEINAKIPAEKSMERQKATMDLYSKVGVSPLAGCLPALLQMPFLIALFNFFPAAIELRHQSFLWAPDLSTYDSIFSWKANIPLISWLFDNHISLFCLLFTATTIISSKLNMDTQGTTNDSIPGMKMIMYLMPVMFMFVFNNYASGLCYYYFISTLITLIQTYAIRATVDEKKLLAQLHAKRAVNSKKPAKKGGFMERLEKMQREQQKALQNRKK